MSTTIEWTNQFKRQQHRLPDNLHKRMRKALQLLADNHRHPSLRVRKLGAANIYEARVNHKYRFTFERSGCRTILRNIDNHGECIKKP